jgi:hypothetical protein
LGGFIWEDPSESDAGSIINGDMNKLVTRVLGVIAWVTRHASTWTGEAAQFFDIQVDELAGVLSLVAHNRRRRHEEA